MNPSDPNQDLDQQARDTSSPDSNEEVISNNQVWQIDHTEIDILLIAASESIQ
jgi:hypothetical protein